MTTVVLLLLSVPGSSLEFQSNLAKFNRHYQTFVEKLFDCSKEGVCHPERGTVDYKEWAKTREEAKKLFDLEEKRK
jgi:hypothetical protein